MQFEELTTPRLRLRKLTPEVYAHIYSTMDDAQLMEFLGLDADALYKEKDKFKGGLTTFRTSILGFQVINKATGTVMGMCGYHNWYTNHSRAELGYHLTSDAYKQQGFMTEALETVIDYGFNQMGLNRIEALIAPQNIPSRRLLERYGFTKEGVLHQHYFVDGIHEDSEIYRLLKKDYNTGY
jgi:[ribosomal protein S5]-alanine N-acetyltransferase